MVWSAKISPDKRWMWWQAWRPPNGGPTPEAFHLISMDGKRVIPGNTFQKQQGTDSYLTKELFRGSHGFEYVPVWLRNSKELVAAERNNLFLIATEPKH